MAVLCAIFRAHTYVDDYGHLEDVARHSLPLGKLVEDLVTAAAEEVAVHDFRDDTSATHGIADGGADDSGLGNGGVKETMRRQRLGEAAIDGKGAAPLAILFAIGDKAGVLVETIDDGFKESVADVERLHLADGLAFGILVETLLTGNLLDARVLLHGMVDLGCGVGKGVGASVGEHHIAQQFALLDKVHARRKRVVDSQLVHLKEHVLHLLLDGVEVLLRG